MYQLIRVIVTITRQLCYWFWKQKHVYI